MALVVAAGFAAVPALAAANDVDHPLGPQLSVMPALGVPQTHFTLRFRTPQRTGRYGASERRYQISGAGPARKSCASSFSVQAPPSPKNRWVSVRIDPEQVGGVWCIGTYHGRLQELQTAACPRHQLCPTYVLLLGTVGKFAFRVDRPGRDSAAPRFAGLVSAFACTPGAQRPAQLTPFNLSWKAASDDQTPSSQIVYDIFASERPGAEDFSSPTWTTSAGVTSYRTPGLPSHGTVYFVVRARDRAGNEERNRVERRGVDPCV